MNPHLGLAGNGDAFKAGIVVITAAAADARTTFASGGVGAAVGRHVRRAGEGAHTAAQLAAVASANTRRSARGPGDHRAAAVTAADTCAAKAAALFAILDFVTAVGLNVAAGNFDHAAVDVGTAANTCAVRRAGGRHLTRCDLNLNVTVSRVETAGRTAGAKPRAAAGQRPVFAVAARGYNGAAVDLNGANQRNAVFGLCGFTAGADTRAAAGIGSFSLAARGRYRAAFDDDGSEIAESIANTLIRTHHPSAVAADTGAAAPVVGKGTVFEPSPPLAFRLPSPEMVSVAPTAA